MRRIYFDNAATTPIDKRVLRAIRPFLTKKYGNPSSVHKEGREAKKAIEKAREQVAKALNCLPCEIYFTSGASESNATILNSGGYNLSSGDNHDSIELWENVTTSKQRLNYFYPGINNETGDYGKITNPERYSFVHVDLTQVVGKRDIDLSKDKYITSASLSGHKFGGLKGTGVLFVRQGYLHMMQPLILGHQEREFRGGTENVVGIVALGKAIELAHKERMKNYLHIMQVASYIDRVLNPLFSSYKFHISGLQEVRCRNGILSLTFKHLNAQSAVQILDRYGVAVSAGSACNSNSDEPSKILLGKGYTEDEAKRTIRVSIGKQNTIREAKRFCKIMKKVIDKYDNL